MNKIDKTVIKETEYILTWSVIMSALLQAVFLILGKWEYTVVLGNLLGLVVSVGNFFLMGITVQKAVLKDEKDAKTYMKASQSLRTVLIFALLAVGILLKPFNTIALIIPIVFPRIAILLKPFVDKNYKKEKEEQGNEG